MTLQDKLVRAGQTVRLLRFTNEVIRSWAAEGFLKPADGEYNQVQYSQQEVDAVLAAGAINFPSAPTVSDLIEGRLTLLTAPEFRALLRGRKRPSALVEEGHIAAIKIRGRLLYSEQSTRQWLRKDKKYTSKQTRHILGISPCTLTSLINDGTLQKVRAQEGSHYVYITFDSLAALLKELLPSWIAPSDWIEDRLKSSHPLVFIRALQLTEKGHGQVLALLKNERIQYIGRPKSKIPMISPESHLAFLEAKEAKVTDTEFAQLFGVSRATIYKWDRRFPGWRTCSLHPHSNSNLYKTCVVKILQGYLTGGSPHAWYTARLTKSVPLIDQPTAMEIFGTTNRAAFTLALQNYKLTHLTGPNGLKLFSRASVLKAATKHRAARSD